MENEKKKGLNTNSNSYTIIYSVIIVIIVAFLLAFVSKGLEKRQNENVALDAKKQILYALNIRDISDEEAKQRYTDVVLSDDIIDKDGNITTKGEKGGESAGFQQDFPAIRFQGCAHLPAAHRKPERGDLRGYRTWRRHLLHGHVHRSGRRRMMNAGSS